ncbi:MAG: EamA family transporter [Shimia sp.]
MGVAVIVAGSVGRVNLLGDALALAMTCAMATVMVIYRARPETPGAGPSVLQSAILMPLALAFGGPFATGAAEGVILAVFGLVHAFALVSLTEGAKRVPASQTALIGTLETPLAPLLAFVILSELLTREMLLGAAILWSLTARAR